MNRSSIVKFKQTVYPYHIMREWYASYNGILPEDQKKIFLRLKELFQKEHLFGRVTQEFVYIFLIKKTMIILL